jgi:Domain of unknown function (DUF4160)
VSIDRHYRAKYQTFFNGRTKQENILNKKNFFITIFKIKGKFRFMPTVLFINGLRFFFYSNEGNEPIHIHVSKADAGGKIWLLPVIEVVYLYGFSGTEQNEIHKIVLANYELFKLKWNEHFGK